MIRCRLPTLATGQLYRAAIMLCASGFASFAIAVTTAADAPDTAWQPPTTEHGDPDLQGIWTNATYTTLERPDGVDALELTAEQAKSLETKRDEFFESYDEPEATEDGELPEGEDPGGYNTFWMDEGTQLASINGRKRSSIIVDPADGQIPYKLWTRATMLYKLRNFLAFDHPEQRPLGERCIVGFGSTGGPPMLPVLYNNHYQIVQSPGHVVILVEMNHDARIVRLDSEHLPPNMNPWLGDSIGHWEGNTLVVETTNFHPGQGFRASTKHFLYTSENLKVTERFTRTADDEILYQFAMDDPDTYSQTWHGELPLRKAPGPIYEYACHEGNYAMPGILAGAREEERNGKTKPWWQRLLSLAD